jgi:hypothetical protein
VTKNQIADIGERAGWTLAQAAVAFGITEAAGLKEWWALPLATALSAAKTWVQHKLDGSGQKTTEGTSPQEAP